RRRHTRSDRDWSSDVCSSDLAQGRTLPDNLCEVHLRADFFFQIELFLREFVLELGDLTVGKGVFDGNCDLARGMAEEIDVFGREIGRASCRERWECWVGSGGV